MPIIPSVKIQCDVPKRWLGLADHCDGRLDMIVPYTTKADLARHARHDCGWVTVNGLWICPDCQEKIGLSEIRRIAKEESNA